MHNVTDRGWRGAIISGRNGFTMDGKVQRQEDGRGRNLYGHGEARPAGPYCSWGEWRQEHWTSGRNKSAHEEHSQVCGTQGDYFHLKYLPEEIVKKVGGGAGGEENSEAASDYFE